MTGGGKLADAWMECVSLWYVQYMEMLYGQTEDMQGTWTNGSMNGNKETAAEKDLDILKPFDYLCSPNGSAPRIVFQLCFTFTITNPTPSSYCSVSHLPFPFYIASITLTMIDTAIISAENSSPL